MKQYRQCRLRRGDSHTTGWIEVRGARTGALVELESGRFWEVLEVFEHVMSESMLKEHQQLNRHSLGSIEPIR